MESVTPCWVKSLASDFAESLRLGTPRLDLLHIVGERDASAAEAFSRAAADRDLAREA